MDGMVLEIFALSILRTGAVHGYELKRRVQRPSLTALSNNSLYPMLRRFEIDGLVTKAKEPQEGKPDRNVYAITDAGVERLRELLCTLPPGIASSEEEFLVRVGFFQEIPEANQRAIIAAREAYLASSRARVAELLAGLAASRKSQWRERVLNHVVETIENEQTWIATLAEKAVSP
jgi:DNA-binding PadR family transcriptional regulator